MRTLTSTHICDGGATVNSRTHVDHDTTPQFAKVFSAPLTVNVMNVIVFATHFSRSYEQQKSTCRAMSHDIEESRTLESATYYRKSLRTQLYQDINREDVGDIRPKPSQNPDSGHYLEYFTSNM